MAASIPLKCRQYFELDYGFYRGSVQKQPAELFYKEKVFLEISQNAQENTCTRVSFLIKSLTQVFSCEFCEIS